MTLSHVRSSTLSARKRGASTAQRRISIDLSARETIVALSAFDGVFEGDTELRDLLARMSDSAGSFYALRTHFGCVGIGGVDACLGSMFLLVQAAGGQSTIDRVLVFDDFLLCLLAAARVRDVFDGFWRAGRSPSVSSDDDIIDVSSLAFLCREVDAAIGGSASS